MVESRIALVSHSFLPQVGGVEYAVHGLATTWSRAGHRVAVFNGVSDSAADTVPEHERSYEIVRYRVPRGASRAGLHRWPFRVLIQRSLESKLRRFAPDLICVHNLYPCGVWLRRCNLPARSLLACHNRNLRKGFLGIGNTARIDHEVRATLSFADRITAINTSIRNQLLECDSGLTEVAIVPNGVDLERFAGSPSQDVRARLGIPHDTVLVLSVGRNHGDKGLDRGLRAFSRAAAEGGGLHYLVVGRGSERLADEACTLGIAEQVTLVDGLYGDDLVAAYAAADIFLLPSRRESFPLVVLEAMAAGLPVIATDSGGHRDVVDDPGTGRLIPVEDDQALGRAIRDLADDPETRLRQGAVARDRVRPFGWDAIAQRYLDVATDASCTRGGIS